MTPEELAFFVTIWVVFCVAAIFMLVFRQVHHLERLQATVRDLKRQLANAHALANARAAQARTRPRPYAAQ